MLQFLTESVVLTTLGGILGILAGIAIASILAYISDMDVVFPLWAILVGFFFSMAVGVVFGAMPAVQAAKTACSASLPPPTWTGPCRWWSGRSTPCATS